MQVLALGISANAHFKVSHLCFYVSYYMFVRVQVSVSGCVFSLDISHIHTSYMLTRHSGRSNCWSGGLRVWGGGTTNCW